MTRRTVSRDAVGHWFYPLACQTKGVALLQPERAGCDGRLWCWTATLLRPQVALPKLLDTHQTLTLLPTQSKYTTIKGSPVYTHRGDDGTTGLVGGTRISRGHIRLECCGTVDEPNSHTGALLTEDLTEETHSSLLRLQHILLNVAGSLVTPPDQEEYSAAMKIDPTDIEKLEHKIDELDATLPRLGKFILPSGDRTATLCHVCRTVCRHAERNIHRLHEESRVDDLIAHFVSRLSDYFFVLAHTEALRAYGSEVTQNRGYSTL